MSITVYWSSLEDNWLEAKEPSSVYKKWMNFRRGPFEDNVHLCPGTKDSMKNLYEVESLYSYSFKFNKDGNVWSEEMDQDFFESHVRIRNFPQKFFSFTQSLIFFSEEKTLPITIQLVPFLEENRLTEDLIYFPGMMDIGKWFRSTDFAFYFKENKNEFSINKHDIMYYIKFHTDEKIIFKKFFMTDKLLKFEKSCTDLGKKHNSPKLARPLSFFYNNFTIKKNVLKEIKENLC